MPFPQEALWKETLNLLSEASDVDILTDSKALENLLPFNSRVTRKSYGSAIVNRFSRLEARILRGLYDLAHSDISKNTIEQIWRVLFCLAEPVIALIYLNMVWPREPGVPFNRNEVRSYVETTFSHQSRKLNQRVIYCLKQAGYLMSHGKDSLIVVGFGNLEESLILIMHLLLAQSVRTIKLSEIEASDFWKFLGFRKFDHVRICFQSAEARGLLLRYAKVDHLEQVTTKYSWQELLLKCTEHDNS